MADPDIMAGLERTMGFRPVPGTLNIVLDQAFSRAPETEYIPATQLRADWESATGQAGYWLIPVLVARTTPPGRRHRCRVSTAAFMS